MNALDRTRLIVPLPAFLHNLSERPEVRDVEKKLREALAEKMIVDFDDLPLPDLMENPAEPAKPAGRRNRN